MEGRRKEDGEDEDGKEGCRIWDMGSWDIYLCSGGVMSRAVHRRYQPRHVSQRRETEDVLPSSCLVGLSRA